MVGLTRLPDGAQAVHTQTNEIQTLTPVASAVASPSCPAGAPTTFGWQENFYLAGRLDICFENMNACRTRTQTPPRDYLRHIYYDSVTYRAEALALCVEVGGADHVMYGSDYPHNIGDMKGCLARVDALPAAQREAVRSGNAQRIFRL